ncbi:hypothetical protein NKH57_01900 [Mesorhizobium sp. M1050]|uniref:hypothetical protein n=1 Tax=Mesorhizobium sp. M1050 TaxID=2957051 RepID=UPI003334CFA6
MAAIANHLAAVHHRDRIGDRLHRGEVVGDEQEGDVFLQLQIEQQLQYAVRHQRIER